MYISGYVFMVPLHPMTNVQSSTAAVRTYVETAPCAAVQERSLAALVSQATEMNADS